ncbi:pyruvate dehydrogenase (quinone) [Jatrophihabitans sp. GAS493]|uniref:thiamine pyrophosphate-dependent enzyme n=1 Tax=Jatrophihabitans sp. GAS493 TaxID=1907575 RepID=UPI000BB84682|nr:thiamine pyrophosphate-dependent enzyme [Jatrophihabitans sp. GAS493]SOD71397.1 pyruvate dehydrogenase (quinone) [Jatrophihabitans sp. GAS493]
MTTVAEMIVEALAEQGVRTVWGVVGDALNPITDAIRRDERIEWLGVRHEEVGAFAAGAQAQLTGTIGVCMGTVGPGSIHLLNGLYDAKKSHAPVLAICGQVPLAELGSDYFQEVNNDLLFTDVAVYSRTVTAAEQAPTMLQAAIQAALQSPGVAVLTLPGDVGELELPKGTASPRIVAAHPPTQPSAAALAEATKLIDAAEKVTLLVGIGARGARDELLALARKLNAPMVLSLKAKPGLEQDNPYQVGQSGLIGNPAASKAFDDCDLLLMVGTDFPYREWYPVGKTVVQVDVRAEQIGRRTSVDLGLVGHAAPTLAALAASVAPKDDELHLSKSREAYESWVKRQQVLTDPQRDKGLVGRIRERFDNSEDLIRPELLADLVGRQADEDAIFTTDTGMSTVWLSRFVTMSGRRELLGSFNLGSMANAMPQALGAQALDRRRQVIAFCGDGGLSMLLGDLITAVSHNLPVKLFVFNNGRLGMVKLEQEQGGLPEFGTVLDNPDFAQVARAIGLHANRVEDPLALEQAVRDTLKQRGPALLDVVTNPQEIALPGKVKQAQAWGFAIAKIRESVLSEGDS